ATGLQRTALSLRAAEAQARATGPADAAALLMNADESHPRLLEQRAGYRAQAGDTEGAASDLLAAAQTARDHTHRTRVLYQAGLLFEEPLDAPERALEAYLSASELQIGYRDLFERCRRLLTASGDTAELSRLLDRRLAHGGETPVLVELYLARAELAEQLGDGEAAREALRSALALTPDHADALKRLGQLCLEAEEWPRAAEALIRLARLRQDREELRFIFFTLGDIYDRHTPDPKRARAAFERVLKLSPDDLEAMERLAGIHRSSGHLPGAIEVLTRLIKRELDPDESRRHRLVLASIFEEMGDLRRAEAVLEQTRRNAPTEIEVLVAQADFYQRQGAASALSMHLNRAIDDFRRVIGEDPSDVHAWPGLAQVLKSRGREDAARCVASAATALGITDVMMSPLVDARGAIPGAGQAAAHPDLDPVLSPPRLSNALRQVFRVAGSAFDKALPVDTRALGASKASGRDPLRAEVQRVAALFGLSDVQLLISERLPTTCLPISGSPITLVLGHQLAQHTTPEGRVFLFARALKIASDHLALAVRTSPSELALLLGGLLRGYDPEYEPQGVEIDSARLDDMARRVHKAIGRRGRDDLMPLALEMNGTQGYDPTRVGVAAAELGDRVALVATGDTPAAFRALLSLAGIHLNESDGTQARLRALRQSEEAFSLLSFAISDAYFDARHRVGADRR
ncbi:MAG: tetratricopeptide repeat protein, partial [Deltaproteobacteria bacterium]|nr:tetratricopeptide repeat protein [Deltaproteobacteria bacterium]